jgi:hypothetical protein
MGVLVDGRSSSENQLFEFCVLSVPNRGFFQITSVEIASVLHLRNRMSTNEGARNEVYQPIGKGGRGLACLRTTALVMMN